MARHRLRRTAALAAAVFVASTSAAAVASAEPSSGVGLSPTSSAKPSSAGSASSGPASSAKPSSSGSGSSSGSAKLTLKRDPAPAKAAATEAAAAPSAETAPAASPELSVAPAASADAPATPSAVGDDVATVPVTLPSGIDDGRVFPDMTNTPDGTAVLVGGSIDTDSGVIQPDTWIFKDGTWLPVCGTTVPGADAACALPPRQAGALGTAPGGVIMFGGHPGGLFQPSGLPLGDTWKFDGTAWHQVCADFVCGPEPRAYAAIAGNSAMTLMFGGLAKQLDEVLDDTWAFDGTKWTQLCGTSMGLPCGPSARFWSSMSWDGTHFVLFGGAVGAFDTGVTIVGDTWIWTGSSWQLVCDGVATPCGPAPRGHGAFPTINSPDPAHAGSFLAGGMSLTFSNQGESTIFRDLWFWSARDMTWRQLSSPWGANLVWSDSGPPPADGLPLGFVGAATNDCGVLFYGTVMGPGGVGVSNVSTLAGWDNGSGSPATCADQQAGTPAPTTGRTVTAKFARADLARGLPLTGESPWSGVAAGALMVLVGACLLLACRRRAFLGAIA